MKTLTIRQYAAVKRIAQNVSSLVIKKNKLAAQIKELTKEYESLTYEIEGHESGVRILTGGFTSEDLMTRVVEPTGKFDKDGKPIKITKYIPNPETLKFNEEAKVYEIIDNNPTMDEAPAEENIEATPVEETESAENPLEELENNVIGE